jgi:hypothetical protein
MEVNGNARIRWTTPIRRLAKSEGGYWLGTALVEGSGVVSLLAPCEVFDEFARRLERVSEEPLSRPSAPPEGSESKPPVRHEPADDKQAEDLGRLLGLLREEFGSVEPDRISERLAERRAAIADATAVLQEASLALERADEIRALMAKNAERFGYVARWLSEATPPQPSRPEFPYWLALLRHARVEAWRQEAAVAAAGGK